MTAADSGYAMRERDGRPGAIVMGGKVNGLGVVRSLGRLGVRCALVYVDQRDDYTRWSRHVKAAAPVRVASSDSEIRSALDGLAEDFPDSRLVVIPTADRFSQFLTVNRASLEGRYAFNSPTEAIADAFLDKWKTAEICRKHGMRIPDTYCPATESELRDCSSSVRYPVIIKPRYTFSQQFPGKNAEARNRQELLDFFQRHDVFGISIVQEVIPSGDGDIFAIASYSDRNGKVIASVCWRKLRQHRPDYGATCFGISETNEPLESENSNFLENMGYNGFSMTEFARSRDDSRTYFLELNTRTAWPNQLFADVGVDLTRLAYMDISGADSGENGDLKQRDGVIWIDLPRDRASMRLKREKGEIKRLQWLRSITKSRSFAYFSLRDPLPFLMVMIWRRIRNLRRRLSRYVSGKQ